MNRKPDVHQLNRSKARFRARSRGFSLIEILLVVGLAAGLLAIGIAASTALVREGQAKRIKSMLQGLDGALSQYRAKSELGVINHDGAYPINWDERGLSGLSSSERFVLGIQQFKSAEKMMEAAIKSGKEEEYRRNFKDAAGDGYFEIYDRWGTEIQYRSSNRHDGGKFSGVDNDKLPVSKNAIFVSAGPDKEFGTDDDITSAMD